MTIRNLCATFVFAAVCACGCDSNSSQQPNPKFIYGKQPPKAPTPIAITADALAKEIKQDQFRARDKYRDRELVVSGESIGSISLYKDSPAISLKTDLKFLASDVPIRCEFPIEQTAAVLEICQRQQVKILGKLIVCSDHEIVMKPCEFVEVGPSTGIVQTPEEIVQAAIVGGRKAEVGYFRRTVFVTGIVDSVRKGIYPERSLVVALRGKRNDGRHWEFQVFLNWEKSNEYMSSRASKLAVGDTIRLRGSVSFPDKVQSVSIDGAELLDLKSP